MKKIRFKREIIGIQPFVTDVMNDKGPYYYFYDEYNVYKRIKKIHENKKYTITSTYNQRVAK